MGSGCMYQNIVVATLSQRSLGDRDLDGLVMIAVTRHVVL
jgi:hypothetical protein